MFRKKGGADSCQFLVRLLKRRKDNLEYTGSEAQTNSLEQKLTDSAQMMTKLMLPSYNYTNYIVEAVVEPICISRINKWRNYGGDHM